MKHHRHLIFPLTLAIILGGLSAWLERISTVNTEEVKLDPNQPQYAMTHLAASRFDLSGSLKESLLAKQSWQLPDQKNIYLRDAHLQTYLDGQVQYSVAGLSARYQLDNKKVYFDNKVVLEKNADSEHPAATVATEHLIVDTVAQTAQTHAPVLFTYGASHGSAHGAFYDYQSGKLDLPHHVKAMIYHVQPKN